MTDELLGLKTVPSLFFHFLLRRGKFIRTYERTMSKKVAMRIIYMLPPCSIHPIPNNLTVYSYCILLPKKNPFSSELIFLFRSQHQQMMMPNTKRFLSRIWKLWCYIVRRKISADDMGWYITLHLLLIHYSYFKLRVMETILWIIG